MSQDSINIILIDSNNARKSITCKHGDNLMDKIVEAEIAMPAICNGNMMCATCMVNINDKDSYNLIPEVSSDEEELMEDEESYCPSSSRLSCQIFIDEKFNNMEFHLIDIEF